MEAQALPVHRFRSRRFWIVSALVALAATVAALLIAAFIWLRSYAPLEQGSSWRGAYGAEAVTVEPLGASGGVPVVFPRYRLHGRFHVSISLANTGRLGVTVLGVRRSSLADSPFVPVTVEVSPLKEVGTQLRPLDAEHPVRIEPGEERSVTITYRIATRCIGGQPRRFWAEPDGVETVTQTVAFRFRYARWFERSQRIRMPLAIALACRRGVEPLSSG